VQYWATVSGGNKHKRRQHARKRAERAVGTEMEERVERVQQKKERNSKHATEEEACRN
jgi:hypothetical protein